MRYLMLIIAGLVLSGCAKQYVPVRYQCLPDPPLEQIEVRGGSIDKTNTPKVLNNHVKMWEYIEYLKLRGCK